MNSPSLPRPPAAVILDFDGVIADSLDAHLRAWQAAVQQIFHVALLDPESIACHATPTIAGILAKRFGDAKAAKALTRAKAEHLLATAKDVPLIAGADDFLKEAARRGLKCGIASNSTRDFISAVMKSRELEVEVIVSGEDVSRPKPCPDIFWECSNRLDVATLDRARVLVFEDSVHGLTAATRAGMVPIGVTSLLTSEALARAGAVATCADLIDALSLL